MKSSLFKELGSTADYNVFETSDYSHILFISEIIDALNSFKIAHSLLSSTLSDNIEGCVAEFAIGSSKEDTIVLQASHHTKGKSAISVSVGILKDAVYYPLDAAVVSKRNGFKLTLPEAVEKLVTDNFLNGTLKQAEELDLLSEVIISLEKCSQIAGELFILESAITSTQINILRRSLLKNDPKKYSDFFKQAMGCVKGERPETLTIVSHSVMSHIIESARQDYSRLASLTAGLVKIQNNLVSTTPAVKSDSKPKEISKPTSIINVDTKPITVRTQLPSQSSTLNLKGLHSVVFK